MLAMPRAIDPVPSPNVNSQFRHALTDRLRVAEVASFDLS